MFIGGSGGVTERRANLQDTVLPTAP